METMEIKGVVEMMEKVDEKNLKNAAGGSAKDQTCLVRCKSCGSAVSMPRDSYLSSGSVYNAHHLCPNCARDVYGSSVIG